MLMVVVAISAILIHFAIVALGVLAAALMDDTYYSASRTIEKTWQAGPSPRIEVDLFEGYINVVQGTDGQVSAVIEPSSVTKVSQAAADAALDDITISAVQQGDTIRITTRSSTVMSQLKADIELRVPPDASLDLLTGHGYIYIGKTCAGRTGLASSRTRPSH